MYKPERLAAFCDGVMAIAITLLVLGLQVPSATKVPERELIQYLYDSIHSLIGFVSSFMLVGTYWLQHYVIFHYIHRVDRGFVAINGLFLLVISFVPFPTGLQATYRNDHLAFLLYAGTQILCGLMLLGIWIYATRNHRLVASDLTQRVIQHITRRTAVSPILGVVAICVSLWNINLGRIIFLGIPIIYFSRSAVDAWSNESKDDK